MDEYNEQLTRGVLLSALQQRGMTSRVAEATQSRPPTAEAQTSLVEALQRVQRDALSALPVVDRERLVGLLTMENILELLIVSEALPGAILRQAEPVTGAWSESWGSAARAQRWSSGTAEGEPGPMS
jgi:CBS domain-containing protein